LIALRWRKAASLTIVLEGFNHARNVFVVEQMIGGLHQAAERANARGLKARVALSGRGVEIDHRVKILTRKDPLTHRK
jgi:hypothetical protein